MDVVRKSSIVKCSNCIPTDHSTICSTSDARDGYDNGYESDASGDDAYGGTSHNARLKEEEKDREVWWCKRPITVRS